QRRNQADACLQLARSGLLQTRGLSPRDRQRTDEQQRRGDYDPLRLTSHLGPHFSEPASIVECRLESLDLRLGLSAVGGCLVPRFGLVCAGGYQRRRYDADQLVTLLSH